MSKDKEDDRRIREAKFNREYKNMIERDRRTNIWDNIYGIRPARKVKKERV